MTIQFYAQPYDITASGFHFNSLETYCAKAAHVNNKHGSPVEEFEIQFIYGDAIDCALAKAMGLSQANLEQVFAAIETWTNNEKLRVIVAANECGYDFTETTQPDDFDVVIYHRDSLRDLAEHFVEDGLYGDIPERLRFYIDYDAIARDLGVEYTEAKIAGQRLVYLCA